MHSLKLWKNAQALTKGMYFQQYYPALREFLYNKRMN